MVSLQSIIHHCDKRQCLLFRQAPWAQGGWSGLQGEWRPQFLKEDKDPPRVLVSPCGPEGRTCGEEPPSCWSPHGQMSLLLLLFIPSSQQLHEVVLTILIF